MFDIDVDFEGIGKEVVTMHSAAGLVVADEGKVGKVSAEKTIGLCAAENNFYGLINKVDLGGGVSAVQRKGFATVAYTGAPALGLQELVANGAGGVKPPAVGVQAFKITGVEGDNNAILFTAKGYGVAGHDIRVQLKDPAGNDQVLAVDVVGKDIIVSLATGGAGAITSTADLVKAAIEASAAAALVTVADEGESTGAGVVAAVAIGALAGGVDASVGRKFEVVSKDAGTSTLVIDLG